MLRKSDKHPHGEMHISGDGGRVADHYWQTVSLPEQSIAMPFMGLSSWHEIPSRIHGQSDYIW